MDGDRGRRRYTDVVPRQHPTVSKVVAILEMVASNPEGATVSGLARILGNPKSTVHTLVQGLLATDYLQDRAGRLQLGPGVALLTSPLGDPLLQRLAHQELERLVAETGETAQLAMRLAGSIVVLDQVQSEHVIRYAVALRARRPLLTTSGGKLFLAELPVEELTALLDSHDDATPAVVEDVLAQRDAIRAAGVAYNIEESVAGVAAASTGIRTASGDLVAAFIVAGPAARVRPELDAITAALHAAARRVSERLTR